MVLHVPTGALVAEPLVLPAEAVLLHVEPVLLQVELMLLQIELMLLHVETTNGYLLNLQVKKLVKELIPKRGRMIADAKQGHAVAKQGDAGAKQGDAGAKQGDAGAKNSELRSPEHLLERKKERGCWNG